MSRDRWIDQLRWASRQLSKEPGSVEAHLGSTASDRDPDSWMDAFQLEPFHPEDFADWPESDRNKLEEDVAAFNALAKTTSGTPIAKQRAQRRRLLQRILRRVGDRLLRERLDAQRALMHEASTAAQAKGWYFEKDEKRVVESLLGEYKAPRLRIRTKDRDVVLDPIARFGAQHRGVVDLVVLPSYETAYLMAFQNGNWHIVSPRGREYRRPFNQSTFVHTISRLDRVR